MKLAHQYDPVKYLFLTGKNILLFLNIRTRKWQHVRQVGFPPTTPPQIHPIHFAEAPASLTIQTVINISTPASSILSNAACYLESLEWSKAYGSELEQLDCRHVFEWLRPSTVPEDRATIPLNIHYSFKRDERGYIRDHNVRCALRGNRMSTKENSDPEKVTTDAADKSKSCFLVALSGRKHPPTAHLDNKSTFPHKPYDSNHAV